MTEQEYERLQERFRRKLQNGPYGHWTNKGAVYEEGVRACMSILKDEYKHSFKEVSNNGRHA